MVHESHGLGVYRGIEKVESENVIKDYMKISYRDGGNLYVFATSFDSVVMRIVAWVAGKNAVRRSKGNEHGKK